MARKLRIQYPGAIYHVMNRGDRREAVFKDERDRECFLEILGEAEAMEERRREDDHGEFKVVERGWFLGSEEFRQELLEQVKEAPGGSHYGEAVHEAVEARAERWVRTELAKIGWTEEQLQVRRKGDPVKVKLAGGLRSRTALPLAWIARRLSMGTRGHLAWLLQRSRVAPRRKDTAQ